MLSKSSLGLKVFQNYFFQSFIKMILSLHLDCRYPAYPANSVHGKGDIFMQMTHPARHRIGFISLQFEPSLFSSCRNTNVLTEERVQVDHELNSLAGQVLSFGYKCFPHVNYFLRFSLPLGTHLFFCFSAQHFSQRRTYYGTNM